MLLARFGNLVIDCHELTRSRVIMRTSILFEPPMSISKYTHLQQIQIEKPCSENWEAMDGNEQQRFCDKCVRHVHNIAEMDACDAEALLSSSERVCTRLTVDAERGILTRSGWIPRVLLAGAVASFVNGCSTGEAASTTEAPKVTQKSSLNPPDLNQVEKKSDVYVFYEEPTSTDLEKDTKPKNKKSLK
jgi:hypothetical protein